MDLVVIHLLANFLSHKKNGILITEIVLDVPDDLPNA